MMDDSAHIAAEHGEQEENYFISMTDMMVGVLFIFIIMLMTFALNFRTQTDVSEEQLRRLKEAAAEAQIVADRLMDVQDQIREELKSINQADQVRSELLQKIRSRLAAEGLNVVIDELSGVLRLTEDAVRFPFDSADLTNVAALNVAKIARVLAEILPEYTALFPGSVARVETVFIEGHTDRTGNPERNWRLSTERAVNTYRGMIAASPTLKALRNSADTEILSVSGYAETRPVPGVAVDNLAVHRRIDLRFVMEVDRGDRLNEVLNLTDAMQANLGELRRAVERANAP
jgi:flagellar motor protein MotB